MTNSNERIDELEIRYSHLSSLLEDLNTALIDHEKRMSKLEEKFRAAEKLLLELKDTALSESSEPAP